MARPQVLRCIRRFCLECQGGSAAEVRTCVDASCALWAWRFGDREDLNELDSTQKKRAALRCIRVYCLACAGQRADVRACNAKEQCAFWSLRFGVYPETYKKVRQRFFAPKKISLFK